jgi:hypothetical protein
MRRGAGCGLLLRLRERGDDRAKRKSPAIADRAVYRLKAAPTNAAEPKSGL